ncbi:MAG: deoxynucleoside kinase [bacterium]|nr:deoxynucleoside kinase [bacterium]
MGEQKYIVVAGNIGSGKSSLVQFLVKEYGVTPFYESNDANPYLEDFYKDMQGFAFQSQIFFLSNKFKIHQELEQHKGLLVIDRAIYEDAEIFATALSNSGNIKKLDFEVYFDLYKTMCRALRPPDLLIYLKCSVKNLQKRIRFRGRAMEKSLPVAYLKQLQLLYDEWIAKYNASDVVIIETDKLDYVTDLVHRIDVKRNIEKFL